MAEAFTRRLWEAAVERALRATFGAWERLGVHVTPVHYFQPIPDTRRLDPRLWSRRSELPGIEMREAAQLALLDRLAGAYGHAWRFPGAATSVPWQYHHNNRAFEAVDAEMLYALVRDARPSKVIEIGGGYSTYVIAQALRDQRDVACDYLVVEPYPGPVLRAGVPGVTRLGAHPVQAVPIDEFTALGAGDVLFIDSTHVLAIGSDVQYEFLEILPRLAPGVLVHVHDIFLPSEYPREWVLRERRFWTEQYLLQAFLAFNRAFEVVWAGSYMHLRHPAALERAFSAYRRDRCWPGSFWLRRTA